MKKIISFLIALAFFLPVSFSLAMYSPIDYFKITYEPAIFSKTEIIGREIFNAVIKSRGVAFINPPSPVDAVRFSYRYTARNKLTGEEVALNPFKTITIEPFPKKLGESYEISNEVPLQFPAESGAGDYVIIEEITNIEIKDFGLGWQSAPKPSKPSEPAKPIAPTKPSEPTKPSAPIQLSAPTQPSAPTKPSAPTDSFESKPTKPTEPSAPSEPMQPPEPTKPSEPVKSSEPTKPSEELSAPPGPHREIGIVKYFPDKLKTSEMLKDSFTPEPKPAPISQESKLATPKTSCSGVCVPVGQSGPSGMMSQGTSGCESVPGNSYKCGFFGWQTCYNYIFQICYVPISIPVTLTVSPTAVVNGTSAVGTVTLGSPASVGGQVVKLSTVSNAFINIPTSMTVKAGETSGTFDISTYVVNASFNATIKAKLGNYEGSASLTINPTAVSAFTVSPTAVINGVSSAGTVTLSSPAPIGGRAVLLSATPGGSLAFPTRIIIKAGETSGTFDIQTKKVNSPVNVTITARLLNLSSSNSSSKTAQLTINPTPLPPVSVTVSQSSVTNGATVIGTVTLGSPAPFSRSWFSSGGQVVQLSATPKGILTLPSSIKVGAGKTSGTFNITTKKVSSPVNATITATMNNSKATASLTVNPAPSLTCTDSDNGRNYAVKGSLNASDPTGRFSGIDNCQNKWDGKEYSPTGELNELYCLDTPKSNGGTFDSVKYKCPNGCSDGACLPAPIH